jgi:hypothetical protein
MYDTVVHNFYCRERETAMSHRRNLWTVSVLSFVTFAMLVPTVCYAGLGEPLPVEDESSQAVTLDRLRDALLEESRIGGYDDDEDPQGPLLRGMFLIMIAGTLITLIVFLIVWALCGSQTSSRKKGKWQMEHEKSSSGNSGQ